jgi:hypothetical protein
MDSIGKSKVGALEVVVKNFSGESVMAIDTMVDETTKVNRFCFAAFDNIASRKTLFERWLEIERDNGIFIDGRLEAEQMWIYCVRRDRQSEIDRYWDVLRIDDSILEEAPCTFRQTSHAAAMIASHMIAFFTNHLVNMRAGDEVREIPFRWEYYIPVNLLIVE